MVPLQDFDFASSNAKFDKEQILRSLYTNNSNNHHNNIGNNKNNRNKGNKEKEDQTNKKNNKKKAQQESQQRQQQQVQIVIPEPDSYYDKSKSFFDDISCDAKERAELKKSGYVIHVNGGECAFFMS